MTDGHADDGRLLERRDFFVAASALVGGGLAAAGIASAATVEKDMAYVAAKVVGHPSVDVLEVVPAGTDVMVRVELAPGARAVHRDNASAQFADFKVGDAITFDVPGPSDGHLQLSDRDRGRVFAAVHVADCRPGTTESRGRSVS